MMQRLFDSKPNKWSFYWHSILFTINDRLFRNAQLSQWLWNEIKQELFYISGQCWHSGNCCRHIMIYDCGKALDTLERLNDTLSKDNTFNRFLPHFRQGGIACYSCKSLTEENKCRDYDTRPKCCRMYPMNVFIDDDRVLDGCGYSVALKDWRPIVVGTSLLVRIDNMKRKNNL